MRTGMGGRILFLTAAAIAVGVAAVEPSLAQCAMCKQSIAGSTDAESMATSFNLAVLVLLVPPVAIFAGIFGVFYRYRNLQEKRDLEGKLRE